MAEPVSKQEVKNYLEIDNRDLTKEMEEKIDDKDNWSEVKKDLISLLTKYANNPTSNMREELKDFISRNYTAEPIFGRDALDKILSGLRINELSISGNEQVSEKSIRYKADIYEKLGIENPMDIINSGEEEVEQIKNGTYNPKKENKKDLDNDSNSENKNEFWKNVSEVLKKIYFQLTKTIVMAPGEVPPEILEENRQKVAGASDKLDIMIADLESAYKVVFEENESLIDEIPDNFKTAYKYMREGKMTDETLSKFEVILEKQDKEYYSKLKANFEKLQNSKLESKLRELAETKFSNLSKEDIDDEIEYAMKDSKVDKDGKLILPKNSVFKDIIFDENGEVINEQTELANMLVKYAGSIKINSLSKSQIENLLNNTEDFEKLDKNSKEYKFAKSLQDNVELLPDSSNEIVKELDFFIDSYFINKDIMEEAEMLHKVMVAKEVKGQIDEIQEIVARYDEKENNNGELDKDEKMKRQNLLKVARNKVSSLEKAGLSQIIQNSEDENKRVLTRARGVLLPKLEKAKSTGERYFRKVKENQTQIVENNEEQQVPDNKERD